MNAEFFFIAMIVFVGLMAAVALGYLRWSRRREAATWEDLLARLKPVNRTAVKAIALDLVDEAGHRRTDAAEEMLDASQVWEMIGGLSGLEIMEQNCEVLVEIAAYAQRWYPEAVVVAEQLRLNAREVQFHLGRLKGAVRTGNLHSSFGDYGQRAVAAYYRMTRAVLALYEETSSPGFGELARAI